MAAEHVQGSTWGTGRRWRVWVWSTLLLLGSATAASAADSVLRGPGKALSGDPVGDVISDVGEPIDATRFAVSRDGELLRLRLELASAISPADSGREDALYGFIDLDLDQQEATGETAVVDYLTASASRLGSDLVVDLSTYRRADGNVDVVFAGGAEAPVRVPAAFGDRSVELELPLSLVGDDGSVSAAAVVGNVEAFTDAVPDGGFLASTDEGSEGVVLGGGRFAVDVSWRNSTGGTGAGSLVFQSDDSAVFWFFKAGNWELMVKVVDGCALNDRFWIFSAATTDVEFTIQVTDTATGTLKTYRNPQGVSAPAVTDTDAFATCGAGS